MGVLHIEPCPVIPDEYDDFIGISADAPDLDLRPWLLPREFDCVGNQVNKNQSQHRTISITNRECVDLPSNIATVRLRLYFAEDFLQKLIKAHHRSSSFCTSHPRKCQKIINQHSHLLRGFQDYSHIPLAFVAQHRRSVFLKHLCIACNMSEWRT